MKHRSPFWQAWLLATVLWFGCTIAAVAIESAAVSLVAGLGTVLLACMFAWSFGDPDKAGQW